MARDDHPPTLILSKLGVARALSGISYFEADAVYEVPWIHAPPMDEMLSLARRHGKKGIGIGHFNIHAFAKLLAKIALGYAYAELGSENFIPLVRDIILGRARDFSHFVGGSLDDPPPATSHMHQVWHEGYIVEWRHYLVVYIRLFADMGAPVYHVVVGEASPDMIGRHILTAASAEGS